MNKTKELIEKLIKVDNPIYPLFILCMIASELFIAYGNIFISISLCLFLLILLIVMAIMEFPEPSCPLYLALTLFPLIRIVSVAIPMTGIPETFQLALVGIPLFLSGIIVAKMIGLTPKGMGFVLYKPHRQLLIALLGLPLGFLEFFIDRPDTNYTAKSPVEIIVQVFIFIIFTGLLEEFLYRGILFNTVATLQGDKTALYFTSFLYTAMTVSGKSLWDILYVFFLSVLFCRLFGWLKSLWGLSLAHGLLNITFFILCPRIFG